MPALYLLLFFGCFVEGEITVIGGVIAVHYHWLRLEGVMLSCLLGAFAGDVFFFELGRRKGQILTARWPRLRPRLEKISRFLDKYPTAAVLLLRFQIAMRTVGNFALGLGTIPRRRYLILNLLASILWAIIIPLAVLAFIRIMGWLWQFYSS